MPQITVRKAGVRDAGIILGFVKDLAEYEKALDEVVATKEDIKKSMFGPKSSFHGLICSINGKPAGFAVYFYSYSTWLGKPGLYLEDLFVSLEFRGNGAGKALLKELAKIAVKQGCPRFEWSVLDWNTPAIEFYESLGAEAQKEWVRYRLSGEALSAFADSRE